MVRFTSVAHFPGLFRGRICAEKISEMRDRSISKRTILGAIPTFVLDYRYFEIWANRRELESNIEAEFRTFIM